MAKIPLPVIAAYTDNQREFIERTINSAEEDGRGADYQNLKQLLNDGDELRDKTPSAIRSYLKLETRTAFEEMEGQPVNMEELRKAREDLVHKFSGYPDRNSYLARYEDSQKDRELRGHIDDIIQAHRSNVEGIADELSNLGLLREVIERGKQGIKSPVEIITDRIENAIGGLATLSHELATFPPKAVGVAIKACGEAVQHVKVRIQKTLSGNGKDR